MGTDSDPKLVSEYDFLRDYQVAGKQVLKRYLGTSKEIDFPLVNKIIESFKTGEPKITLKRMGRSSNEVYFETIDFSSISVLFLEWTHGNNNEMKGVDFPVFLYSTPKQTLEHRLSRARDKGADSPFVSMVLMLEQKMLNASVPENSIIIGKTGNLISIDKFRGMKK